MLRLIMNTFRDIATYNNDLTVPFTTIDTFGLKPSDTPILDDGLIKKYWKTPSSIPMVVVVEFKNNQKQIFFNTGFSRLPQHIQNALLSHEQGHIVSGIGDHKIGTKEYYQSELDADLYAIKQGHDMFRTLVFLMHNHPYLIDIKRLINIKKFTGCKDKIPLDLLILGKIVDGIEYLTNKK